ncbi:hypothetical protein SAMD00019534_037570, partial [Acytostelium subglobosum LB1]|uniref:hypothetical protein n=1 Tax=Acytostelium subglobosum LB1 TaxID=1410327 RepID=UPI0006451AD7
SIKQSNISCSSSCSTKHNQSDTCQSLQRQQHDKSNTQQDQQQQHDKQHDKQQHNGLSQYHQQGTFFKKVTDEQFAMLDQSTYIQTSTRHNELRQLIMEIDDIEDEQQKIQRLDHYRNTIPEFNEFVLKMLATIGSLDNLSITTDGVLTPKKL